MDNRIEIVSAGGSYVWRVLTADGIQLCEGRAADRITAAHQAIEWTEGTITPNGGHRW